MEEDNFRGIKRPVSFTVCSNPLIGAFHSFHITRQTADQNYLKEVVKNHPDFLPFDGEKQIKSDRHALKRIVPIKNIEVQGLNVTYRSYSWPDRLSRWLTTLKHHKAIASRLITNLHRGQTVRIIHIRVRASLMANYSSIMHHHGVRLL